MFVGRLPRRRASEDSDRAGKTEHKENDREPGGMYSKVKLNLAEYVVKNWRQCRVK